MSQHTPSGRRITARVVPIKRLDAPAVRRISPETPTQPAPTGRSRIQGARLASRGRFYRPGLDDAGQVGGHTGVHGDDPAERAELPSDDLDAHFILSESADADASMLVFWDQAPTPQEDDVEVPRWVSNVALLPDEMEFEALGQYLVSMVDGFANFCRAPSVSESGNWQARLQMPPAVLPETLLDMSLSAVHARLRFETQHPVSRALLERHVDGLREQVREALAATRDVEVALW